MLLTTIVDKIKFLMVTEGAQEEITALCKRQLELLGWLRDNLADSLQCYAPYGKVLISSAISLLLCPNSSPGRAVSDVIALRGNLSTNEQASASASVELQVLKDFILYSNFEIHSDTAAALAKTKSKQANNKQYGSCNTASPQDNKSDTFSSVVSEISIFKALVSVGRSLLCYSCRQSSSNGASGSKFDVIEYPAEHLSTLHECKNFANAAVGALKKIAYVSKSVDTIESANGNSKMALHCQILIEYSIFDIQSLIDILTFFGDLYAKVNFKGVNTVDLCFDVTSVCIGMNRLFEY